MLTKHIRSISSLFSDAFFWRHYPDAAALKAEALVRLEAEAKEPLERSSRELGQLADIDHTYVYRLETGEKQSPSEELLARLLRVLKAAGREIEMAHWFVANDANPDWVAHTLATPDLTAEMFEMGASMRHRGEARPDMQTIEARVRKAFED